MLMVFQPVNAQLFDRGNGLIFDDVYKITWLADANYAATSMYSPLEETREEVFTGSFTGQFIWEEAKAWVKQLNYKGIEGWRLPSHYINPDLNVNVSEVAHITDLVNTNPVTNYFHNIQTTMYWSSNEYADDSSRAWMTYLNVANNALFYGDLNGYIVGNYDDYHQFKDVWSTYAWAVIDGDVGAVPLPAASWLFTPALVWLLSFTKTRRRIV